MIIQLGWAIFSRPDFFTWLLNYLIMLETGMANECAICGKKTTFGIKYARRGAAKARGGSGAKISGKTGRHFKPNLQTVRANVNNSIQRIRVCTACLSAGKVKKAAKRQIRLRKSLAV
jgi:large subunit ribosomal protein L28